MKIKCGTLSNIYIIKFFSEYSVLIRTNDITPINGINIQEIMDRVLLDPKELDLLYTVVDIKKKPIKKIGSVIQLISILYQNPSPLKYSLLKVK